jgi:cytochrome d ubiquinol oxidase subunit I
MVVAAFVATALVVAASAALQLLRRRDSEPVRKMFTMALGMLLVAAPLQAFIGDLHGLNTLEHQPAKLAAIEGHWENHPGEGVPLVLFGMPDMDAEETRYAIEVPRLGSLLLTHTWDGQFAGLKEFAPQDRPNATVVFWTFRLMVGLGLLMIALALGGLWLRWRGRLFQSRAFLRFALWMGPSGLVALLAGWFTTEVGRQPWVVYGLMRTADAVSPSLTAFDVALSLAAYVLAYLVIFGGGFLLLRRLVRRGPPAAEAAEGSEEPARPHRPLSAVTDAPHLASPSAAKGAGHGA